jgi:hypothetical protein
MHRIARFMARVVGSLADEAVIEQVRNEVEEMATAFPLPGVSRPAGRQRLSDVVCVLSFGAVYGLDVAGRPSVTTNSSPRWSILIIAPASIHSWQEAVLL